MKLYKLFTIALAAVAMTACSDDDDFNSASGVSVGMLNPEMSVKETKGLFDVPVVVTGEANGPISVTIAVETVGSSVAVENEHYVITTKNLNIPAGVKSVNVEVNTIDDGDLINDPRQFQIVITECKGATIGQPSTLVTIKDSDSEFYEKLQGKWTFKYTDNKGAEQSTNVTITGAADDADPDYNNVLYLNGWQGYNWVSAAVLYHFDLTTKEGYLEFPYGQIIAEGVNFGDVGICDIVLGTAADGYAVFDGSAVAHWDSTFKNITFDPATKFYGFLFDNGKFNGYNWFSYVKMSMAK